MLVYVSNDGDVMFKTLAWFEKLISPTSIHQCWEQLCDAENNFLIKQTEKLGFAFVVLVRNWLRN